MSNTEGKTTTIPDPRDPLGHVGARVATSESTAVLDPDQEAVYSAEDTWLDEAGDLGFVDPEEDLRPESVTDFVLGVIEALGVRADPPVISFDVADEDQRSGWVSGRDRVTVGPTAGAET